MYSIAGMMVKNGCTLRETHPSSILSPTYPIWTALGLNLSLTYYSVQIIFSSLKHSLIVPLYFIMNTVKPFFTLNPSSDLLSPIIHVAVLSKTSILW
jgi:hypothetical protein